MASSPQELAQLVADLVRHLGVGAPGGSCLRVSSPECRTRLRNANTLLSALGSQSNKDDIGAICSCPQTQ